MNKVFNVLREYNNKCLITLVLSMLTHVVYGERTGTNYDLDKNNGSKQELKINGKVTNIEGIPLPGVNVVEAGTTNGVITDLDGNYSIRVISEDAVLRFSFVGYLTEEIEVAGQSTIDVTLMEDLQALDEVVVVGYGVKKKENLTGSVAVVDGDELEARPVTGINEALNGVVPNLTISPTTGGQPGAISEFQIRGQGSLESGSSPLFLVDGIETDPSQVNPTDIESISVLKDAAAASIYGARASYGVVLITTKSGQEGKPVFNFSMNNSWRSPVRPYKKLGSVEHMEYWRKADMYTDSIITYFTDDWYNALLARVEDPSLPAMLVNQTDSTRWGRGLAINEDWYAATYQPFSPTSDYNLSVSGGKDNLRYYFSGGFLDQDGLLNYGADYYKRLSFLGKFSGDITDWLTLSYRIQYTRSEIENATNVNPGRDELNQGMEYIPHQMEPIQPVFDPNGHHLRDDHAAIANNAYGNNTLKNKFINTLTTELKPFKGLNLISKISYDYTTSEQLRFYNLYPLYNVMDEIYTYDGESSIERKNNNYNFLDVDLYGTYQNEIGDHGFTLLAGYQQQYWRRAYMRLYGNERIADNIYSVITATGDGFDYADLDEEWTNRGFFGRINYVYKEKFLLEANARYDGSSRFPERYKWGFFPSASVGYIISREAFFQPLGAVVDLFKLRASYGRLGNMNVSNIYYQATMTRNTNNWLDMSGTPFSYMTAPGLGNGALTWEKPTTLNLGADINLFQNKLQTSFDWFKRVTKDMIGPPIELPKTLGTEIPKANNTELTSTGWEFTVTHKNTMGDFKYNIGLGLSASKVVVTKYPSERGLFTFHAYGANYGTHYYEGMELGEVWGYTTVGFIQDEETRDMINTRTHDQSQIYPGEWRLGDIMYADLDGDGMVTPGNQTIDEPGDLTIIGNETPDFLFNINLSVNWKNFDIRTFWTGSGPAEWYPHRLEGQPSWYNGFIRKQFWGVTHNNERPAFEMHKDHWTPENTDAYFPKPVMEHGLGRSNSLSIYRNTHPQTKYLQKAAYIRLKNLQLGYRLPGKLIEKVGMSSARVYVSGENLFTLTNLKLYDPEFKAMVYPLQKVYSFGLNLRF